MSKIVTEKVTDEDIQEARKLEDDPLKILALIDIIFMNEDKSKIIPSKTKQGGVHRCIPPYFNKHIL